MEINSSQIPPVFNAPSAPSTANPVPINRPKAGNTPLLKTVIIILLALLFIGAILLAYYFYSETISLKEYKTNFDAKLSAAVADSEREITIKLENEFEKRENALDRTFAGPVDYGSLNFKYPKTWSVYIEKDASSGGDFVAYLHPDHVNPVSHNSINALRVTIDTDPIDRVLSQYKSYVDRGTLSPSTVTLSTNEVATRYDGTLNNNITGSVLIFKIRDKTVIIQTDAEIYRSKFDEIIKTITYNQ